MSIGRKFQVYVFSVSNANVLPVINIDKTEGEKYKSVGKPPFIHIKKEVGEKYKISEKDILYTTLIINGHVDSNDDSKIDNKIDNKYHISVDGIVLDWNHGKIDNKGRIVLVKTIEDTELEKRIRKVLEHEYNGASIDFMR